MRVSAWLLVWIERSVGRWLDDLNHETVYLSVRLIVNGSSLGGWWLMRLCMVRQYMVFMCQSVVVVVAVDRAGFP